jgi:hypothetical protein
MSERGIAGLFVIPLLALVCAGALVVSSLAQNPMGDANAPPAPFNPQMGALMGMLIQPRHAKLGLAGKMENWPLAGYALRELKQGFAVTARAVPRLEGRPVADLFEAAVSHPLTLLDYAIKLRFRSQFDEAYEGLTKGCNACHAMTSHGFIVIKAPDASPFPDQEFTPKQ